MLPHDYCTIGDGKLHASVSVAHCNVLARCALWVICSVPLTAHLSYA